ncbi:hypothetical protein DERF_008434 [Dermatophagoides farinae]|uniref:Uncharacterized protein n=1 Tax=Dermatophagoides farinae TaxID=6954 RepID=A0A922I1L5_DERFA|nr:hypothetical protein DERF_008434 [Dermatophagoides farinae]
MKIYTSKSSLISFHLEMAKKASTTTTNENFQISQFPNEKKDRFRLFLVPSNHRHHFDFYSSSS